MSPLSSKLDLCSVSTVASQTPVLGEDSLAAKAVPNKPLNIELVTTKGPAVLKLKMSEPMLSLEQRAIFIRIETQDALPQLARGLSFGYGLADSNNQALWFADQTPLIALDEGHSILLPFL